MTLSSARPADSPRRLVSCVVGFALLAGLAGPASASKVKVFRASASSDFLAGEMDGVSVGPLGKVRLARALDSVASVEEPFLFTAAVDGDGWVVGTGNSGKVLRIAADGTVSELFTTDEAEVFALLVEEDAVWAAASPDARVYRWDRETGEAEAVLDTGERYVWALAREEGDGGRLLVATGTEGRLLAWDGESEEPTVLYDADDTHLRTLLVRDDDLLVGTVGEGRILSLRPPEGDGDEVRARTLFDADQPEITSLTAGPDGSFFAAAVASEASLAQLSQTGDDDQDDDAATPPATGTRPTGFEGARSVVLHVRGDGSVETLGSFEKETVYSLLHRPTGPDSSGQLWVATGQEGKLYRRRGEELVLERDLDELQLVALLPDERGMAIATTNGAGLYRTSDRDREEGTFTSKVLDAKMPARFGTLHYEAEVPEGGSVRFSLRSGQSAFPDDTWSPWVDLPAADAASGLPDLDLSDVPRGRYLQWRARLAAGQESSPVLSVAEVSYLQENQRPQITELEILDPGVILVQGSFNPSNQVYEPMAPNRDGIFVSVDEPATDDSGRPKQLWKLGYRTARWKAEDPNGDSLRFELAVRAEGSERWYPVVEETEKTHWGFDTTVLPDGLYRIRVRAEDGSDNAEADTLSAERTSGVVIVDNSPPRVVERSSESGSVTLVIEDELSPLRSVEMSVDAGEWEEVAVVDGLTDSRRERVEVQVPEGAGLVLLRLSDAAYNAVTVSLSS